MFGLLAGAGLLALSPAARGHPEPRFAPRRAVAVNPVTGAISVANTGGRTVSVVDRGHGVTTVGTGGVPAGVTVDPRTGLVYVANAGIHHPSVIDGNTREGKGTILLRSEASSVAVHERSGTIYTNGGHGQVAVGQFTGGVLVTDPPHVITGF